MLQTGNQFLVRSDVLRQVGEDAFVYGLLIGHEDMRLISKVDADILVTFAHGSFQEFLGSMHLILRLSEGDNIGTLLGTKPAPFLSNPLFLQFCLWFINQNNLSVPNQKKAEKAVKAFISQQINMVQVELEVIEKVFPAIDFSRDPQVAEFLKGIIKNLNEVKCLWLTIDLNDSDAVADYVGSNLQSLSRVITGNQAEINAGWLRFVNHVHCDGDFDIVLAGTTCNPTIARQITNKVKVSGKKPSVFLSPSFGSKVDLLQYLNENVSKLFINNIYSVVCPRPIIPCPHLTHLFLVEVYQLTGLNDIASSFLSALSAAIAKGNLPTLSHLSFEDCWFGLTGQLHLLFQCTWPTLIDLNFKKCYLDMSDIEALSLAHEKGFFPVLKSLSVGYLYTFTKLGIYDLLKVKGSV